MDMAAVVFKYGLLTQSLAKLVCVLLDNACVWYYKNDTAQTMCTGMAQGKGH